MKAEGKRDAVYTIGHSTRTLEELIGLLKMNSIEMLVDIRTIPRSKTNPQFNLESLPNELRKRGIGYVHMKGLGGLRRPRSDSKNTAWRNLSFRGYADYMQTEEFAKNLAELEQMIEDGKNHLRIALMCAEAVPWRCHRFLVSDALLVRGYEVLHIIAKGSPKQHTLSKMAKVVEGKITYP
ncbi:MAG TPA: DUF488 domain-containing protein [Nitrososphaerales archaeon]|nr:DUF488 domain-containing protein [Nitrososphaerales archaeon]